LIDGPDEVHLRVVARDELKKAKEGLGRNSSFFRRPIKQPEMNLNSRE